MRLWTSLKVAVVLGGTVIVIVTALISGTDVNAYKATIAAAIEAQTGRKVVFGGDIALSLGRTTTLTVHDVQLANVAGGSGPNMLRIAEATAEVDAWLLRRGEIAIQRLILRGVDVLVEIDKQGHTNFDFANAGSDKPGNASGSVGDLLIQRIGDVDVRDAKVTIHDARIGQTQQLSFQRLRLRDAGNESLMSIAATGRLDAEAISLSFDLEGRVGVIAALVAQNKLYPVDLRGTVNGVRVAAAGTIADPFAAAGLVLHVDVSAANLSSFTQLFDEELPSVGPVRLVASLTGTPAEFALGDLSLVVDESRISGDFSVDLSGERLSLEGHLSATRLDLTPWFVSDDETQASESERLLNNDPIPFTALQDFDGKLSITAETLVVPGLLFRDAALSFALSDGQLRVTPASARFDGREFSGDLAVDTLANPPVVSLKLAARDFDVGGILARIFDDEFMRGDGGMDLNIEGRGWSLAEVVGSSSGHVRVLMDAGQVKTGSLGLLVGGVSELLPGLGSGNAEWTAINCVAGDFDLRGGVATSRIALLDSEVLRLVGEGQIDMAHDTLEFYVAPSAKKPTLNVAVPVNL
ncbi:MAG: AsmA family protein, partial [Alphaproteobacteria bacterium]|nr:AsmA family protein [Alphaproteobacteria bacterium]